MLPVVEFRTGVGDKLAYAARWLRVAASRGVRVRVIGPDAALKALDRTLWVDDPQDFVPHAWAHGAEQVPGLARTLIWFGSGVVNGASPTLLLNIGDDTPQDLTGLERIVELVGADPDDERAGRQRWKVYLQRGLAPAHRKGES